MRRILPAMYSAGMVLAACTTAPRSRPPAVVPTADPGLYQCAEHAALDLGFINQRAADPGGSEFTATTPPNQVTGIYDGLRVRIQSDPGRVITWVTAAPYGGLAGSRTTDGQLLPSRRAIEAATTVERRCTKPIAAGAPVAPASPHTLRAASR